MVLYGERNFVEFFRFSTFYQMSFSLFKFSFYKVEQNLNGSGELLVSEKFISRYFFACKFRLQKYIKICDNRSCARMQNLLSDNYHLFFFFAS